MPRVPDEYLNCIVYLYPSIPAAETGERAGGTGFIVGIPNDFDSNSLPFFYVVTNKHVVDAGNTTVRFNTRQGTHEAFEYDERNWVRAANADLAIYLLSEANPQRHTAQAITSGQFLTHDKMAKLAIGIGDEVFFAGRFVNAEGRKQNRPTLRFGTIAQMSTDTIDGEESFLVEARSIPGYSGSPVFVYILGNVPRHLISTEIRETGLGPYLLGVDWCHINEYVDARDDRGNALPFKVRSNSGMMGVVPFWKLEQLLYSNEAKAERRMLQR
jgi:hypothetical protein